MEELNLWTRAVQMLGSPDSPVQLGGVIALGQFHAATGDTVVPREATRMVLASFTEGRKGSDDVQSIQADAVRASLA